jgi:class 3 adenylate cyclase
VLGRTTVSLPVTGEIERVLRLTPRSANGHNVIVDANGFLLGTTFTEPFFRRVNATITTGGFSCSSSATLQPQIVPPIIGCRYSTTTYPYAPLQALGLRFPTPGAPTGAATVSVPGNGDFFVVGRRLTTLAGGLSLNFISFIPKSDLLGGVEFARTVAESVCAAILVVAVLAAFFTISLVLQTLHEVSERMSATARLEDLDADDDLADFELDEDDSGSGDAITGTAASSAPPSVATTIPPRAAGGEQPAVTAGAVSSAARVVTLSVVGEFSALEKAYVDTRNALVNFTRYVPKAVVKELMTNATIAAAGDMRQSLVTVSNADIAGFTTLCERVEPQRLSIGLFHYFRRMSRLVMSHRGIITNFIGDCIASVWGAPFAVTRHELLGSLCALAMQREAARDPLRKIFADLGVALAVRIGVASGTALAGNMGSRTRVAYSVVGDPAATASALEPYNKTWGTLVMVSEETARQCEDELVMRLLTRERLAGRRQPCLVYECMGLQPDAIVRSHNVDGRSGGLSNEAQTRTGTFHSASIAVSGNAAEMDDAAALSVRKLLLWHQKRTACDEPTMQFARAFSEAARALIEGDLSRAINAVRAIEVDDAVPHVWRTHPSMLVLRQIATRAAMRRTTRSTHSRSGEDAETEETSAHDVRLAPLPPSAVAV